MIIGYGKIGRSMPFSMDDCKTVGGDIECLSVLKELALKFPEDRIVIIGRNSGEDPKDIGLPSNVINPWSIWKPALKDHMKKHGITPNFSIEEQLKIKDFYMSMIVPIFEKFDHLILWVGQHGTTCSPRPQVKHPDKLTKPLDSSLLYGGYLTLGINSWREEDPIKREEIYLNADARNTLKIRDLKWPLRHLTLAQYNYQSNLKLDRDGDNELKPPWNENARAIDNGLWLSTFKSCYSRVEINSLSPNVPFGNMITYNDTWEDRKHFGIFINEARAYVKETLTRMHVVKHWVLPLNPYFIHGTWPFDSQVALGREITVAPWTEYFHKLHQVRSTFTTPSSGSGWATTKPWEAFAAGTVCFFHPNYDDQNNILKDAHPDLNYLRVKNVGDLESKVEQMNRDKITWEYIVKLQRRHFDKAIREMQYMKMIEERMS
jgi:hypothetical protein